jgi:hypothetical protein
MFSRLERKPTAFPDTKEESKELSLGRATPRHCPALNKYIDDVGSRVYEGIKSHKVGLAYKVGNSAETRSYRERFVLRAEDILFSLSSRLFFVLPAESLS